MHIALSLVGIIVGGIMTLICMIFLIISLSSGKSQNAIGWGAGCVVSIILVIFSVFMFVSRVSERVKDGIGWIDDHGKNLADSLAQYGTGEGEYNGKDDRQNFLDTLQAHINPKYEGKVPVEFYINTTAVPDTNGKIKVPFLYPYSIVYDANSSTGYLISELNDSVFANNISQIAFDENFAIIKIDNSLSPELLKANHAETEYMLFDLRTRNFEPAANKEKLMDLARRIGYTGPEEMQYLYDDYKGWIDYLNYD